MSSTVIRTITGEKEEFLLYLQERHDQALEEAEGTRTSKAYSRGYTDAIQFAMAAVADWQVAPMTDSEILRTARFLLSKYVLHPSQGDEGEYADTVRTAGALISLASARAQQEELSDATEDN